MPAPFASRMVSMRSSRKRCVSVLNSSSRVSSRERWRSKGLPMWAILSSVTARAHHRPLDVGPPTWPRFDSTGFEWIRLVAALPLKELLESARQARDGDSRPLVAVEHRAARSAGVVEDVERRDTADRDEACLFELVVPIVHVELDHVGALE